MSTAQYPSFPVISPNHPSLSTHYFNALELFNKNDYRIKGAFQLHATENDTLPIAKLSDLLKDLGSILSIDIQKAGEVVLKENKNTNTTEDVITFDGFIRSLRAWILSIVSLEAMKPTGVNEVEHRGNKWNAARRYRAKGVQNGLLYPRGDNLEANIPPNYKNNKDKLDALMKKHKEEFDLVFSDRKDSELGKLPLQDHFIFVQECFYNDSILLMEHSTDEQDFFRSVNSYKRLLRIAESYFISQKNIEAGTFKPKETYLDFNECFDIIDYWFKIDENVILIDENEPQQQQEVKKPEEIKKEEPKKEETVANAKVDVKTTLVETIQRYRTMLTGSCNALEKQVIQMAIDSIDLRVQELETGEIRPVMTASAVQSREEMKDKALRKIFDYYGRQQGNRRMNLDKFTSMLSHFGMKIDSLVLKEAFIKTANYLDDLNFEEFRTILQAIAKDVEFVNEYKAMQPATGHAVEDRSGPLDRAASSRSRQAKSGRVEEMWTHMGLYDKTYKNHLQIIPPIFSSPEKDQSSLNSLNNKPKSRLSAEKVPEPPKEESTKRGEPRRIIRDMKQSEKFVSKNYNNPLFKPPSKVEKSVNDSRDEYFSILTTNRAKLHSIAEKKLPLKDTGKRNHSEARREERADGFIPYRQIEEDHAEDLYDPEYEIATERRFTEQENIRSFDEDNNRSKTIKKKPTLPGRYNHIYNSRMNNIKNSKPINGMKAISLGGLGGLDNKNSISVQEIMSERSKNVLYVPQSLKGANTSRTAKEQNRCDSNTSLDDRSNISISHRLESEEYPNIGRGISGNMMTRANQVQQESRRREEELMNNVANIHSSKIEKGLRTLKK